ncbi:hypothetical protein ACWD6R_24415 [Streptomyces sp. NPDC005151]
MVGGGVVGHGDRDLLTPFMGAGAPEGAWTLDFIGITPGAAGRGAGRRLLDRLLADTPAADGVVLYRIRSFKPWQGESVMSVLSITLDSPGDCRVTFDQN